MHKIPKDWQVAFDKYEAISGFEPMHVDEVKNGQMTPEEAFQRNIEWLELPNCEVSNIATPVAPEAF